MKSKFYRIFGELSSLKLFRIKLFFLISILISFHTSKACSPLNVPTINSWSIVGNNLIINASSNTIYNCNGYYIQVELICNNAVFTGVAPFYYTSPTINKTSTPFAFPQMTVSLNGLCPGSNYKFRIREGYGAVTFSGWTVQNTFITPGVFVQPSVTLNASPPNICIPQTSQLTANIINGCGGSTPTYSWSPATGLSCITCSNPIANPPTTTSYTCVVTGGPLGCWTASNVVTVTSNTILPIVGVANAPSPICSGSSATVSISNYSGSIQWQSGPTSTGPWSNVVGATTGSFSTGPLTANVCFVAVVSGCSGSINSNTVCITVNPIPTITVNSPITICSGSIASFVANGGTSYVWSAGAIPTGVNTATAAPLVNTSYTVVGTALGCTASAVSNVSINPSPSAVLSVTNAFCGQNNGIIQLTNTSGPGQNVTNMTLNGNPSFTPQTVINLAPGNYTAIVTNNFGCTFSVTTSIGNTPGITALATTFTNATCATNNGIIVIGAVTGGTPTYSFSFNNGPFTTATNYSNLGAGTYTIVVKDVNNCTFTKTVTLTNTIPPSAINFTTSPTACSANTGVLGITGVTGGVAPFTFSLNNVPTGSVTTNLAAGQHTIMVKDAAGCTFTVVATITTVIGPSAATVSTTPAACGNSNGSATVTSITGGVGPYQYNFNNTGFSTNSFVINQVAGPKSVVIMDANGCTFTVNFNIGNTGSPSSSVGSFSNVSCFGGSNGSFTLNTFGGTPNYNYTLTPGNITSGFGIFTNLTAGNYTVNVMDAMGCVTTVTITIGQPTALTLNLSSLQPSCFGGNNGTITAIAGGGTGPYLYNINSGPNQASNTFTTNITSGSYNITVIDSKGCSLTQSVVVSQPAAVTLTLSSINAICAGFNGVASVTASGGAGGYTYTWTPSGGNNPQTNGVPTGNYTVTVKDQNNCTAIGQISVGATPGGTAVIASFSPVTCFGFNNGAAIAGGIGPFTAPITYSWSNGPTTQMVTNLAPGTYTAYLSDANGCKSNTTVVITQPAVLNFAINSSSVLCYNGSSGSATVTNITGGNPGFTYLWTPGGSTLSTAGGLSAGIYSVTVTDTKGCNLTKTVNITQPSSVTVLSTTTTANCNQSNGSASVSASGGNGPYTYTWSTSTTGPILNNVPAGTYTVAVQDANGCIYPAAATVPNSSGPSISVISQTNVSCFGGNNGSALASANGGSPPYTYLWSNAQITPLSTNMSAGVYTVSVTDNVGCVATASVLITQPSSLTINVSGNNPLCFGATNGNANAGVLGGTPAYNYTWTPNPGSGQGTATPGNMGAGVYLVTVMDSKGCVINGSVQLNNPPQLLANVSPTNVTCFNACNGMANATTTNNAGPVSYFYVGGPSPLATQSVSNLCAGMYTMTATDANNCTAQVTFSISQPPLLVATISAVGSVSCSGGSNGFATINASGGTPGYIYNWSNAQTNPTASNLMAGVYSFTVTDTKSCTAVGSVNITQPPGLTATLTSSNVTCFNANNGIGNVAYSGGTGLPTFLWLPSLNVTSVANNLGPGTHTVIITDGNGCQQTHTINITQPPQLNATILGIVSTNCGQANGSASVAASGGAGGYTYLWSGSPTYTNPGLTNITAGPYTVMVTDANGCTTTTIANVPNIAGPTIANTFSTHVDCFGNSTGAATVVASALVPPMTYLWSFAAQTTSAVTNLPAGLHSITVFDGAGCVASANVQINQPPQLVSAIGTPTHSSCFLSFNGQAPALVNGGTPGYTYSWTPSSQTNSVLTNVGAGIFTCVITDANGCVTSSSVSLTQPQQLIINTNTVVPILCNGGSNGLINTNITGGTPFYTINWASATTVTPPANQVVTNLVAGSYTLFVVDTKGCATSSVYTLNQPTALSIVSTATIPATCGNANGSATVIVTGGTSPYGYNWNTPSPQNTNIAINLNGGIWMLTTTDANGCIITRTVDIPAPALPTVTLGFVSPLCFGQPNGSAWMTPTGNSPFTFNWTPNSATTGTITGIVASVYSGTVTDMYGCKAFGVINVTQPNKLILNGSGPDTICYGRFIQIYAAAGGGTTPYTYNWTTPGSVITSTLGGPHTVTPNISTTYTVMVTDANGCLNGPINVRVNVKPQLTGLGFSVTKCAKDSVLLTPSVTSPGNGGPYTYLWTPGNQSTSSILVAASYFNTPNLYTVSISDGCTIPDGIAEFTVNVNPLPSGSFTSTTKKGCAPLRVDFTATSTSGSDVYTWFLGDLGAPSGTGMQQTIEFTTPGMYNVGIQIQNQFGCKFDTIYHDYIEVWPLPIANFDPIPQTVTLLEPTVTFTNYSIGAVSYYWEFSDYSSNNNSSTAVNPIHTYNYLGVYPAWLVATNIYGCKDTMRKNIEVLNDVGIYIPNAFTPDDNNLNESFYPVGYGIKAEDKYKLEVFDRWGELIFSSDNLHKGWNGRVKGSDKIAQEGVYIYKILITDLQGYKKYFVGHVTVIRQQ